MSYGARLHFAAYVTMVVALGQGKNTAGVVLISIKALCLINSNLDEVHTRYLEFCSLRSLELSYTKNAGKPWIRQSFLLPKFLTIRYIHIRLRFIY